MLETMIPMIRLRMLCTTVHCGYVSLMSYGQYVDPVYTNLLLAFASSTLSINPHMLVNGSSVAVMIIDGTSLCVGDYYSRDTHRDI